jgi:hypothetical protein
MGIVAGGCGLSNLPTGHVDRFARIGSVCQNPSSQSERLTITRACEICQQKPWFTGLRQFAALLMVADDPSLMFLLK